MPFASVHFIFLFLPAVLLVYYLLPRGNWRNGLLVLASLVFFAWVDFKNVHLVLLFILVNYLLGLLIGGLHVHGRLTASRAVLWIGVGMNLSFLGFYKYLGFFDQVIQRITPLNIPIEKPGLILGLSYLTFSSLSYLLDVYHRAYAPEKNLLRFSAYLVMFPKLVQGPIALYKQLAPQLTPSRPSLDDVAWGIRRFVIGLAKKVLIADSLALAANRIFSVDLNRLGADLAWFGLVAYTLVIYFDFAGYTDMAVGIGRLLGFRLPENFNDPYASRSITDFWRRWHMSLTAWFRTYVFIPLEFKRRRAKYLRQPINIVIVFLLTGLWHGASWNFLIWGGYFGVILALEASGFEKTIKRTPGFIQHTYAILLVMIGWVFFRFTDLQNWGPFFRALAGMNGITHQENLRSLNVLSFLPLVLLGVALCIPQVTRVGRDLVVQARVKPVLVDVLVFGLFLLSVSYILANGFTVFMYARF